jgi:acyl-CoA thioester hydrolase
MLKAITQIRVRFYETDLMGYMHHSNYARYYECARTEVLRDLGYSYKQAEADGTFMPVIKIESKFVKPLYYDDLVTIQTEIKEIPRFGIISFYHKFYNEANDLVHEGSVTLAMITKATNKRENGPKRLMDLLKNYF